MIVEFDTSIITFTIYSNAELGSIAYLSPFKYGQSGVIYKVPTTLSVLKEVVEKFGIEKDNHYYETTWKLESSLMINKEMFISSPDDTLRPYQYQGVLWLQQTLDLHGGAGLFWDPRVGKTRTSVKATFHYHKILVMSLAGQEDNWVSNYKDYSDRTTIFSLHKKNKEKRKKIYQEFYENPEAILVGSINTLSADALDPIMGYHLRGTKIDILIVDEIHKLKNHKTNLFKGSKELKKHTARILGLTGTPVSKSPIDIIGIITFLFHRLSATFIKNYFFELETSYYQKWGLSTVIKEKKKQEWIEWLSLMFSSVKKEDVLVWAKDPELINIYLEMELAQLKMYTSCLEDLELERSAEDTEQIQEAIAQMTRLRQISCSPELIDSTKIKNSIKEDWIMEFVDNKDNFNGLIIFSWHTSYLNILKEKLELKNFKVGMITGKTKNKVLVQDQFQNGEFDIILCNIQAGSKGITLDWADTMIFMDKDWKPDENKQASERFTATAPDREKLRKIYSLQTSNKFQIFGESIETIDNYIEQVITNKIKETEIVNKFKELFLKRGK